MKAVEQILHDSIELYNNPSNNKAPLDTQYTLFIEAALRAMREYASEQNAELAEASRQTSIMYEDLEVENERLKTALLNCRQVVVWHTQHSEPIGAHEQAAFDRNSEWAINEAESATQPRDTKTIN